MQSGSRVSIDSAERHAGLNLNLTLEKWAFSESPEP